VIRITVEQLDDTHDASSRPEVCTSTSRARPAWTHPGGWTAPVVWREDRAPARSSRRYTSRSTGRTASSEGRPVRVEPESRDRPVRAPARRCAMWPSDRGPPGSREARRREEEGSRGPWFETHSEARPARCTRARSWRAGRSAESMRELRLDKPGRRLSWSRPPPRWGRIVVHVDQVHLDEHPRCVKQTSLRSTSWVRPSAARRSVGGWPRSSGRDRRVQARTIHDAVPYNGTNGTLEGEAREGRAREQGLRWSIRTPVQRDMRGVAWRPRALGLGGSEAPRRGEVEDPGSRHSETRLVSPSTSFVWGWQVDRVEARAETRHTRQATALVETIPPRWGRIVARVEWQRQEGNGCGDAVRLLARGILRGV